MHVGCGLVEIEVRHRGIDYSSWRSSSQSLRALPSPVGCWRGAAGSKALVPCIDSSSRPISSRWRPSQSRSALNHHLPPNHRLEMASPLALCALSSSTPCNRQNASPSQSQSRKLGSPGSILARPHEPAPKLLRPASPAAVTTLSV